MNRALLTLHGGSLEITLTVPLIFKLNLYSIDLTSGKCKTKECDATTLKEFKSTI